MDNNAIKNILKLSKYVKVIDFDDCTCLFNCLSLSKAYISKEIDFDDDEILKLLERNNFLKNFDLKARKFINKYHK